MVIVASPLTVHYFLSTSHGSTPSHLVPVAEVPELPGNKMFWTSIGEECLLSSFTFLEEQKLFPSYREDKAMRAIWKVLHKLQGNQPATE